MGKGVAPSAVGTENHLEPAVPSASVILTFRCACVSFTISVVFCVSRCPRHVAVVQCGSWGFSGSQSPAPVAAAWRVHVSTRRQYQGEGGRRALPFQGGKLSHRGALCPQGKLRSMQEEPVLLTQRASPAFIMWLLWERDTVVVCFIL